MQTATGLAKCVNFSLRFQLSATTRGGSCGSCSIVDGEEEIEIRVRS